MCWAFAPTNRNLKNLIRNAWLAYKILKEEGPDCVISTGVGVSVPFIYIAWALGIQTIYVESLTRIKDLPLSGRLVYPIVDHIYVQWPEFAEKYGKAQFKGQVV